MTKEIVKVYFETEGYAELVATFESEELYIKSLPALKEQAIALGFTKVTESVEERKPLTYEEVVKILGGHTDILNKAESKAEKALQNIATEMQKELEAKEPRLKSLSDDNKFIYLKSLEWAMMWGGIWQGIEQYDSWKEEEEDNND